MERVGEGFSRPCIRFCFFFPLFKHSLTYPFACSLLLPLLRERTTHTHRQTNKQAPSYVRGTERTTGMDALGYLLTHSLTHFQRIHSNTPPSLDNTLIEKAGMNAFIFNGRSSRLPGPSLCFQFSPKRSKQLHLFTPSLVTPRCLPPSSPSLRTSIIHSDTRTETTNSHVTNARALPSTNKHTSLNPSRQEGRQAGHNNLGKVREEKERSW
mmetsp:Transcript_3118/g.6415  ORF Transcript_3118/g.6415 Transcript_3118/m.6415 type:complete len:211 (-) Transcript_3118:1911-2543(-)